MVVNPLDDDLACASVCEFVSLGTDIRRNVVRSVSIRVADTYADIVRGGANPLAACRVHRARLVSRSARDVLRAASPSSCAKAKSSFLPLTSRLLTGASGYERRRKLATAICKALRQVIVSAGSQPALAISVSKSSAVPQNAMFNGSSQQSVTEFVHIPQPIERSTSADGGPLEMINHRRALAVFEWLDQRSQEYQSVRDHEVDEKEIGILGTVPLR